MRGNCFDRSFWAVLVVSLVILLLLVGATLRYWNSLFSLDVTAGYVSVLAAENRVHALALRLPKDTEIIISRFGLEDPPPELARVTQGLPSLHLRVAQTILQTLAVTPGAQFALSLSSQSVELRLSGGAALTLSMGGLIEEMGDGTGTELLRADPPLPITLVPAAAHEPLQVILVARPETLAPLEILDQRIAAVRFTPPQRAGETNESPRPLYRSELRTGTLDLLDTETEVKLRPRELVWLEDISATVHRIAVGGSDLAVELSGSAGRISVGPQEVSRGAGEPARGDRDVTPTILDYLVGRHDRTFLWIAAGTLLVGLWKARQWALSFGA